MKDIKLEKKISEGRTVDVYESGDLAVKVFKPDCPKTIVFYEALMNAKVEEAGIKVPKITEIELVDGQWMIASELIKGKTLAQLMEKQPEHADAYLDDMLEIQLDIHRHTLTGVAKFKDTLREEIEGLNEIDHIKKYELLTRLDSTPKHKKLCHGNFGPENVIVTDDDKVYIVDWVGATIGNASADIAKTYLKLSLSSTEMAEKYMNLFCEKTATSKKYVQEWLPIMAASTLAKGIYTKEEREILLTWLDVVDYS